MDRLRARDLSDAHALEARAHVERRGLAGPHGQAREHRADEHAEAGRAAHHGVGDREHAGSEQVVAGGPVLDDHLPVRERREEPVGRRLREACALRDPAEALRSVPEHEEHVGRARDGPHRTLILAAQHVRGLPRDRHGHQSAPTVISSP